MPDSKSLTLTGVMPSQNDFDKINQMCLWSYDLDLNLLFRQSLQSVVCPSFAFRSLFFTVQFDRHEIEQLSVERLSSVNSMWRFGEIFTIYVTHFCKKMFCHHCIANARVWDQTSGRFSPRLKQGLSTRFYSFSLKLNECCPQELYFAYSDWWLTP